MTRSLRLPPFPAVLLAFALAPGLVRAAPGPEVASAPTQGQSKVLLERAHFWLARNRPDRAREVLQLLLAAQPGNAEAQALLRQVAPWRPADPEAAAVTAKWPAVPPAPTQALTDPPPHLLAAENNRARAIATAQAMIENGQYEAAERLLRAAIASPSGTATSAALPTPAVPATMPSASPGLLERIARFMSGAPAERSLAAENGADGQKTKAGTAPTKTDMPPPATTTPSEVTPATWVWQTPADGGGTKAAEAGGVSQVADTGSGGFMPNPFRASGVRGVGTFYPVIPPAQPRDTGDPLRADIDSQLRAVQEEIAPKIQAGPSFYYRTGTAGLGRLYNLQGDVRATVTPFGTGELVTSVQPVNLNAGAISNGNAAVYGTGPLFPRTNLGTQSATGAALNVAYSKEWLKVDVGSTPLGFQIENVVGGVELSPRLSEDVRLRIIADRRAITNSLLSWGGAIDPATRTRWGGVLRNGGYARLEATPGAWDLYAGGGYGSLNGTNVASNQEYEATAGFSYPIWYNRNSSVRLGLDLFYFGYDRNLGGFTLGQGGYFSPRTFLGALIPIRYLHRSGDLDWGFSAGLGVQHYEQHASPIFPNNPDLESAVIAQTGNGTLVGRSSQTGFLGNAAAFFEYRLSPRWTIGGNAGVQNAGNWTEAGGRVYARYTFTDVR